MTRHDDDPRDALEEIAGPAADADLRHGLLLAAIQAAGGEIRMPADWADEHATSALDMRTMSRMPMPMLSIDRPTGTALVWLHPTRTYDGASEFATTNVILHALLSVNGGELRLPLIHLLNRPALGDRAGRWWPVTMHRDGPDVVLRVDRSRGSGMPPGTGGMDGGMPGGTAGMPDISPDGTSGMDGGTDPMPRGTGDGQ